ncbi:hypothetical protein [Streptomyces sp. GC420]|uniref:hypothetical protein n=1 Tax=Streptomyces sp. GC420 TaxID=2697568 RepID=UPI001414FA1D|nr:hypothetical protein [Streptomyces sp. GC420]NBM19939.1 hypothetical protein [Streptomyces sp. GC420]
MLIETVFSAVSAAGLGIALLTAYRKRFLAATRIAAYSLIPVGLVMTGVVDWVADLVFKPSVWAGFGVLALSWALFVTARTVERRKGLPSRRERRERRRAAKAAAGGAPATRAVGGSSPGVSTPSLGPGRGAGRPAPTAPADDFSDIEAILKKHGI